MLTDSPSVLGSNGINPFDSQRYVELHTYKHGKHGDVTIVTTPVHRIKKYAIKAQTLKDTALKDDRVYRELRVLHRLSSMESKHFVQLHDWWKWRSDEDETQMAYLLEYGGEMTLSALKSCTQLDFKSILFQVLFTLHVAQVITLLNDLTRIERLWLRAQRPS